MPMWNISFARIGGMWWLKLGRLCFAFTVTRGYRPLPPRRTAHD